jgi:large subunit ribosomal protein L10
MPTLEKENIIAELGESITSSSATLYTDYRGLSVAEVTALRKKLREVDAEFHIVKNTLFKRAAADKLPMEQLEEHLAGPTAVGFAKGDVVAATKALLDFMKDHKQMALKAGVVDGKLYSPDQVTALSKLPPKEQIIAQILGAIDAPASNLVGTLDAIIGDIVFTIQAISDQKGASAPAEA